MLTHGPLAACERAPPELEFGSNLATNSSRSWFSDVLYGVSAVAPLWDAVQTLHAAGKHVVQVR